MPKLYVCVFLFLIVMLTVTNINGRRRKNKKKLCKKNNGGCEHICSVNQNSVTCACNQGFTLLENKKSCHPCGININKSSFRRIVGGQPTGPKEWPWMAALILKNGPTFHHCGGSLINDRYILTAAHCLTNLNATNDMIVRLGEYIFGESNDSSSQDFGISRHVMHEDYTDYPYQKNDIAILKLDRLVTFGEFIKPVCLPPSENSFETLLGFVAGWGQTANLGNASAVMMEVAIPVWEKQPCFDAFKRVYLEVSESMLCAGLEEGGKDACGGDSGGPFMVQVYPETNWILAGVVSFGYKCAEANWPGIYTRVNFYSDWITANSV